MVKAKKFVIAKAIRGEPALSDFQLIEEELPPIQDGEILCETVWLSVDPHARIRADSFENSTDPSGAVVALVVESKAIEYPKGKYIVGFFGWRTMTIHNTKKSSDSKTIYPKPYLLPDFGNLPLSLAVGVLGMPGVTANLGFLDICQPKAGETVVVNAAAGAIGSIVGQIAKIKGCRVIGFAGNDEKIKWLTGKLGFDAAYNYKKTKISDALVEAAPSGVDCYFDNVGGALSNDVMARMNHKGRVTVCGAIAGYNDGFDKVVAPMVQNIILFKELRIQGFLVWYYFDRWMQAIQENMKWILEGKLIYEETITEGFENTPKAFLEMLRGNNTGKAVVKI